MKRLAILLLATACVSRPPAPSPQSTKPVDPSIRATIERVEKLIADQPTNTPYIYVLAKYYDNANDVAGVVRWLTRLDELEYQQGVDYNDFPNSSGSPEFKRIARKLEAREPRVNRAQVAFTVPKERKLDSEGIAFDPVTDLLYFSGGPGALFRIDRRGNISELPISPAGQKFGRLGMDVVPDHREIWVINAVFASDAPADEKGRSALSVYDIRDGRLLRRVFRGSAQEPTMLNDLTILRDGTAFVTDSTRNEVLRLAPGADDFEVFASDFRGPNGIATSADEKTLFVADFRGINRFDIATKSRELLKTTLPLNGIDGLVEYRGSLIGIQNVVGAPRVVRVHLADNNRVELLESKNPKMNVPTTGVVAGNEYFFLANLQEKDKDKVVLRIRL